MSAGDTESISVSEVLPSSNPTENENAHQKALQLLATGKRHLLVEDISGANAALSESCELLDKVFGSNAPECGDSYFYYGKALLELGRLESRVIDNALDGVHSDDDSTLDDSLIGNPKDVPSEEAKEISETVDDALIQNCQDIEEKIKSKKNENKENERPELEIKKDESEEKSDENEEEEEGDKDKDEGDKDKDEGDKDDEEGDKDKVEGDENDEKGDENEEKGDRNEESQENKEVNNDEQKEPGMETNEIDEESLNNQNKTKVLNTESNDVSNNEKQQSEPTDHSHFSDKDEEEEEEPSHLQLSWEMLELAKVVFQKQIESLSDSTSKEKIELETKLSEVFQLLGEVSIESENYDQAVEDLTTSLRIREKLLPSDSRSIAETHYNLGVALGFSLKFEEAVSAYNAAIDVLSLRISNLKNSSNPSLNGDDSNTEFNKEKDIETLEKLIPQIKEKIEDTKDMQEEAIKKIKESSFGLLQSSKEENEGGKDNNEDHHEEKENDKKVSTNLIVKKRKKSLDDAVTHNSEVPTKKSLLNLNSDNSSS